MNILTATLTTTTASKHMSIITASMGNGDLFHLLLAEQYRGAIGESLMLAFKESEIILSKNSIATSANCAHATVQKIESGTILSQITLAYHDTNVVALVPTLTFNTLAISQDDEVFWMIQPSEISLLKERYEI